MAPRPRPFVTASSLVMLSAALACGRQQRNPVPPTDVVLATPDSSFWITSDKRGLRMRGAPMLLARVDGRFGELYVTDDDRSYFDAVFVGQRLYMRDLVRGDSVELFADSLVPRLSREYAAANPRETRLAPGEDASDHPGTTVTADLEILGVFGPYLSYEYHTDMDAAGMASRTVDRHAARRGVIDLRTGTRVTLSAIFGRADAASAISAARAEWMSARDSLLGRHDEKSRRAQRTVESFAFDPTSFAIESVEREPQVVFGVPGSVSGGVAATLELTAQRVSAPVWWTGIRDELALGPDSARLWTHAQVELLARVSGAADRAVLSLRDARREWAVGSVTAPAERLMWLDTAVTIEARRALQRAFNEASQYTDDNRIAALPPKSSLLLTRHGIVQPSVAHRARITARHLGAHDADGRERPRARVRGSHPGDDGQDRRGVRHPPLAVHLRDRVGGPRGLPRADSRRRAGAQQGERKFRGAIVDGSGHPDRGGKHADRRAPAHQLVLHDVRRNRQ